MLLPETPLPCTITLVLLVVVGAACTGLKGSEPCDTKLGLPTIEVGDPPDSIGIQDGISPEFAARLAVFLKGRPRIPQTGEQLTAELVADLSDIAMSEHAMGCEDADGAISTYRVTTHAKCSSGAISFESICVDEDGAGGFVIRDFPRRAFIHGDFD